MNKEELLGLLDNSGQMELTAEEQLNADMEEACKEYNKLKDDWLVFIRENFPPQILKIIARLTNLSHDIICLNPISCAENVKAKISVGDIHIRCIKRYEKITIVFIRESDNKTIGFEYNEDKNKYSWLSYPITFWNNLTDYDISHPVKNISAKRTEELRQKIKSIYSFKEMYNQVVELLPQIYEQIAKRNTEYVAKKCGAAIQPTEVPIERKKYKITIDVEEV